MVLDPGLIPIDNGSYNNMGNWRFKVVNIVLIKGPNILRAMGTHVLVVWEVEAS